MVERSESIGSDDDRLEWSTMPNLYLHIVIELTYNNPLYL